MSGVLIDKTYPRNLTEREDYWIHTLKTKSPVGQMIAIVTVLDKLIFQKLVKRLR